MKNVIITTAFSLLIFSCSKETFIEKQTTTSFASLEFRSTKIEAYTPSIVEQVYPERRNRIVNCEFVYIENYLFDLGLFEQCLLSEDLDFCFTDVPKLKVDADRIAKCE